MRGRWPVVAVVLGLFVSTAGAAPGPEGGSEDEGEGLGMTQPVACASIDAKGHYEPLHEATFTSEDKLMIFYRPLRYKVEKRGVSYYTHLVQDGEIHRRGEKKALQRKARMIDFQIKQQEPFDNLYITSMVSLKGLKPGDYDFIIILRDELGQGTPARQTLPFRVVPVMIPMPEGDPCQVGSRQ